MRKFVKIFYLTFFLGCNYKAGKTNNRVLVKDPTNNSQICDQGYDSLLIKYSTVFHPTSIELVKSISNDFDDFLIKADTNCLRKQNNYKLFVAIILSKLYYSHLKCCNQSYDLLTMRVGTAAIIINEFEKMAGFQNQELEMLSSSTIVNFIEKNEELNSNPILKNLLQNIKKEEARISKGNI